AATLEHGGADEVALDDHGVEHALDVGDRRVERHHAGMHALLDAVLGLARQPQQLDAKAELLGELDVLSRDAADAFYVDAGKVDLGAEGGARQHSELVGGVDAVDVEAGIGLGVARRLRLGEHDVEVAAGLAHGGEDVVAGPVQDAVEAAHAVADQALAQRLDDGNAARHGGLEGEDEATLLGKGGELVAVKRQQRLVGGDDVLARAQCGLHQLERHAARAADQLDHDVDVGGVGERHRVGLPAHAGKVDVAPLGPAACARRDEPERAAAAQRQEPAVLGQELDNACAHGAEAGDADSEGSVHGWADTTVCA